ncbi:calcium-binding protein [Kordiimonas aestuarii]|uniref:calcium-binding protein n=1 Tax=Kordiimonas aestuarii TaxID=1005925 RepID=UPI0021D35352|nr:calcium-binding protein [Kordiimonas aestuarii]
MTDQAKCDLKISDLQGIFDFAYQIIGSSEFSWDELLERLLVFPLDEETRETLTESIEIIKNDPTLVDLSQETVNEYLAEYGDIPLCELAENIEGGSDGSGGDGTDTLPGDINTLYELIQQGTNGNDELFGDAIRDWIQGGDGDDTLAGGDGADLIIGGDGDDLLYADGLNEFFDALANIANEIWAGLGNDQLFSGDSGDIMGGSDGDDYLEGNAGDDTLYGGAGLDELDGGAGDDVMYGGAGNDFLEAREGNDTLWGGAGDDNMNGGDGADTFGFIAGSGDDEIWSFNADEDTLDLSATEFDFTDIDDVVAQASAATNAQNVAGVMIDLGGGNGIWLAEFDIANVADINVVF